MASSSVDEAGNPIPTSAVLMSASKHIGQRCYSENLEFIKCKQQDPNPEKCLDKGRQVTRCVLGLKEGNGGLITNLELLDMLNSRGAAKDTTRVMAPVAPSEYKVYDYLMGTVACNQTKEQINEFLNKAQKFNLAKAEVVSIINTRPSQLVELDPIVEQQEQRPELDMEELLELILEVLPPPPSQPEPVDEDKEETADAQKTVPADEE